MSVVLIHPEEKILPYVEGDLSPRWSQLVEHHLQRCTDCSARVAEYRRGKRRSTALASVTAPAQDRSRVQVGRRRRWARNAVPLLGSLLTLAAFMAVLGAAWAAGDQGATNAAASGPIPGVGATPRELTPTQVQQMRQAGWAMPDLRAMGLDLHKTTASSRSGVVTASMTYTEGTRTVTLTEARRADGRGRAPAPATSRSRVIDGATFAVTPVLGDAQMDELWSRLKVIADENQEAAGADSMRPLDRLNRGFARLVDPAAR